MVIHMPRGGARNRSGPQKDPRSRTSERAGFSLTALPNEGYQGDIPNFPLGPGPEEITQRETEIWLEAWRTPQACAWVREPWRWSVVGEYCRLKASIELTAGANAALVAQLHRYRDQIGMTPAGLKENGWAIASAEIEPDGAADDEAEATKRPARRLRAVGDA